MHDDERFTPADELPPGLYERAKALAAAMLDVEGYMVPWLAGRSRDGDAFYPDEHLPLDVDAGPARVKTRRSVKLHEAAELILMNEGETYDKDSDPPGHAHYHANGCEKLDVEEQGGQWTPYCIALRPLIKETDDPALTNLPPADKWDRRPYEDDDPVLAAAIDAAEKSTFAAPASATSGVAGYDLEGASARRKRRKRKAATEPVTKESEMDELKLFIPITKIDAAKRLVYGVATAEVEDRSGEICDYATTKPLYEKWSSDFAKVTDGKSFGNLRAMHSNIAAGKLTDIAFNDDAKQIEIAAKVVDDAEWAKVEEGVYTGFSQGGKYLKRWTDPNTKLTRYTAEPIEISLVDNPCLPDATFSVIKTDGSTELRKFKPVEPVAVAAVPPANPDDGDWEQVWVSKRLSGQEFKSKAALRQALLDLDATEAAKKAAAPVLDALGAINKSLAQREGGGDAAGADAGNTTVAKVDPQPAGDGLAKKDYSADERKDMATKGEAMKDGSYPIKNKSDLENAVQAFGRAKNKAATKRHITKRAKALGATDMLPADWPGSTKDKESKKVAGDGDLKKGANLWSISDLLQLLDGVSRMEENAELPSFSFGSSVDLPKDLCDRFGAALVELGDIAAEMLDAVLSAMKDEEASEAVANAALASDLQKLPALRALTKELAKAGAKHAKADKDRIKKAHDLLAEVDPDCCPGGDDETGDAEKMVKAGAKHAKADKDRIKKAHDLLAEVDPDCCPGGDDETGDAEKMVKALQGELDAGRKAFAKTLDDIMVMVKQIADQPLPMGTSSVRVVEKSHDWNALADAIERGAGEGDGLDRFASLVQRAAQRGTPATR